MTTSRCHRTLTRMGTMLCNVQATLLSQNGIFPSIFRQDQTSTGVAARRPKQSQSGARRGVSSGQHCWIFTT